MTSNQSFGLLIRLKRAKSGSAPPVPVPFAQDELNRRVKCPSCREPMDTHPYFGGGNAVIDTCDRCFLVWLDAGELTVLGRFQSRSGTILAPPSREGSATPVEPPPKPGHSLFGFRIRLT